MTKLYTYDGKTMSRTAWSKYLGISYGTLMKRFEKYGDTPEGLKCVMRKGHYPPSGKIRRKIHFLNREWTIRELSEAYDIPIGRLYERLNAGWSVADSVALDSFAARSRAMQVNGRRRGEINKTLINLDGVLDTFNGHAKRKGLKIKTAKSRVYECGWDKVRALVEPVQSHTEIVEASKRARQMDINRRRMASLGVII